MAGSDSTTATAPAAPVRLKPPRQLFSRPRNPRLLRRARLLGARLLDKIAPKGLYARALIIMLAPIVLIEGVVAYTFLERHWQQVTRRLSESTARDVAALIEIYENHTPDEDYTRLLDLARDKLGVAMQILPPGELPTAHPKPFIALLDRTLTAEVRRYVKHPFWIDTVGNSRHVEIRVKHDYAVLRFIATRNQTYASNSHIFLAWMVGTSMVLLTVAILFLRNQIRPILRLAEAADQFGKGRPAPKGFTPRGAREVRQAAQSFLDMSQRITQHVDQRTTMLAGVSHDLRTVLTRMRLQLVFLPPGPEVTAMEGDMRHMQHMLEDYLAFTKGDGGEVAATTRVHDLLEEVQVEARALDKRVELRMDRRHRDLEVPLKRNATKRAITNLVTNATRFGTRVVMKCAVDEDWLQIEVEDNGPGIPESERENVFRPFYRIDDARNQNEGNSGLGLSITRDIARAQGGNITLHDSELGGLRAVLRLPR